jgi:hypothetical protein
MGQKFQLISYLDMVRTIYLLWVVFLIILGFLMLGIAKKKLVWTQILNFLLIIAICFQWCLLIQAFWNSCFNGFNK